LAKIIAHGRNFLPEDEYRYFLNEAEHTYFFFLGRAALQGQPPEFWKFHKERLASIGYSVDFAFMAKWISLVLLDDIGNPKRTFEYLWPRRTRIFAAISRFFGTMHRVFVRKRLSEKL